MPNRDAFPMIFEHLKKNFQPFVPPLVVKEDTPDNYYLIAPARPDSKKEFFVGAVQVKKNYVSYHLMAIYIFPDLLEGISERLKKRMQGKSCFNFTTFDEEVMAELTQLTAKSFARIREGGLP